MPTESEIDIIEFKPDFPQAKRIPPNYLLLGLDRQSGEAFGNAASRSLDATLCASYDGVTILRTGQKGVLLFPLSWLYTQYPKERKNLGSPMRRPAPIRARKRSAIYGAVFQITESQPSSTS
jgi:hypothetical protein